ncbi:unnamed protein product [Mycena citricolor]|uniref:RNA helicase n=1 Tax=Mycena citricolor TaxID=2018698 RepID=A0AAD2GXS8_9AGAR|nr:unnamed protein product [Mycena citricolor]
MSEDQVMSDVPKKAKKSKEEKAAAKAARKGAGADSAVPVLPMNGEKTTKKRRAEGDGEDDDAGSKQKKKKAKVDAGAAAAAENVTPIAEDAAATRKKDKKDKKKKEKEGDAAGDVEMADAAADDKAERKKRKKEKKEKERQEKAASESAPLAESSTAVQTPEHGKKKKDKTQKNSERTTALAGASADEAAAFLSENSITIHTPPGKEGLRPILAFGQLDIPSALRSSFAGFSKPTPIQACTWPPALAGSDVVGIAETGSGKTLAFGIPALARLLTSSPSSDASSTVSVLVVAPTRELALQTHETLDKIGTPLGIASVAVFGGVPKEPQVKMLRNMNKGKKGTTTRIVVGTPGRILDLVQEGACDLSNVNYLVLDEADRMLDKGFENDIRNIISNTKQGADRQTVMFSATWPEAVRRLASTFQQDPVRVTVGSDDLTANSRVTQEVEVFDDARSKDQRLLKHLRQFGHKKTTTNGSGENRVLVFALYKKEASRVEEMLRRDGYSVGALHGDLSQNARLEALERFKNGSTGLLVATDVAARGLDIPNVGLVLNYTFPLTIEDYIHRIGRTGRGGKSGKSITFFTGDNHERSIAGELAKVLRESGFECEGLKKFPMTIKKKEHSAYGAFFRNDIPMPSKPTKIIFD